MIFERRSRETAFATFALACAVFTLALAPGFARRADADDRAFAIGVDQPLSGIDGADGVPSRNAVLLAIEQENARGFPGGFHAILEDLDDSVQGKHDPAQGALNFKTLVADDRVLAEIGPLNSNVAKAQIPISNATSLAMISNGATAIELTQGAAARTLRTSAPDRIAFFRVCASDDRQGGLVARFAIDHGWKTVYVVDDNESYGRGVADVFAASYVRDGGTLIGREHILPFQFDFKPLLTKVAAMHPQAVFFGGITSTGGGILRKEMGDVGMANVPYLGGDGLDSPQFINLAGNAANGTYYTIGAPEFRKLPGAQPFRAAFRARFHSDPDAYATDAYAASKVALEAIRARLAADPRALPSREDVREAIAATHDVVTPLGRIRFDPSGDIEKPTLSVYRIVHGATEFVLQTKAR